MVVPRASGLWLRVAGSGLVLSLCFCGEVPLHLVSHMGRHLACSPGTQASRGGGPPGACVSGRGRRGVGVGVLRRPEREAASRDGRWAWEDGGVRNRAVPEAWWCNRVLARSKAAELPSAAWPAQAGLRYRGTVTPTRAPTRCLLVSGVLALPPVPCCHLAANGVLLDGPARRGGPRSPAPAQPAPLGTDLHIPRQIHRLALSMLATMVCFAPCPSFASIGARLSQSPREAL